MVGIDREGRAYLRHGLLGSYLVAGSAGDAGDSLHGKFTVEGEARGTCRLELLCVLHVELSCKVSGVHEYTLACKCQCDSILGPPFVGTCFC